MKEKDLNELTVQDCIDLYEKEGLSVILESGKVARLEKEQKK